MSLLRSKRATSFGYGARKIHGVKSSCLCHALEGSPSPGTYNAIESLKKITPIRGFKFILPSSKGLNKHSRSSNPGPGAYSVSFSLYKDSRAPTLKSRLSNSRTLRCSSIGANNVPGPGAYAVPAAINSVGKYVNSRFRNSLAGHFNPPCRSQGRTLPLTPRLRSDIE